MFDLAIQNGEVIDGLGQPRYRADIGIRNGKIVAIGEADEAAYRTIDAKDLVVAPGFIDIHTHYDAQAFWDPTLGPSPLHGVTSVVGGNCGFSIAPLAAASTDYLLMMLARVEGMPAASLKAGVPWDWTSSADFMDRVDYGLAPNTGWLVGHSALRCAVMGEEATRGEATMDELQSMKKLLGEALRAGAMGFSSSWSQTHSDHLGGPVPSRYSNKQELLALSKVVGEWPGSCLEMIPGSGRFDHSVFELLASMSATANRPINWNTIMVESMDDEMIEHQLSADNFASHRGGRVVALTAPDSRHHRLNFATGFILDALPQWDQFMSLSQEGKMATLRSPEERSKLNDAAQRAVGSLAAFSNWQDYILVETFSNDFKKFVGKTVGRMAQTLGISPWDALTEVVLADDLRTVIMREDRGQDRHTWERRVALWRDSRAMIGASDAGAHLDMTDAFSYCTTVISRAVHDFGLLSLEEAIHMLTFKPAELYGLHDRGAVRLGNWADLIVIDPPEVRSEPVRMRYDLPGGAGRLYASATGIKSVLVAGTEVVELGHFTQERPGRVLRSGRDTHTVSVHPESAT